MNTLFNKSYHLHYFWVYIYLWIFFLIWIQFPSFMSRNCHCEFLYLQYFSILFSLLDGFVGDEKELEEDPFAAPELAIKLLWMQRWVDTPLMCLLEGCLQGFQHQK